MTNSKQKRGQMNIFSKIQSSVLSFARKWWRPIAAWGIACSLIVNGVIIPLLNKTSADMVGLATLVTAVAGAFAVREWGKMKGSSSE